MANTINSALIVDTVAELSLTALSNRLAGLANFSSDFSADVKRPMDVVQVALSTAGSTTLFKHYARAVTPEAGKLYFR